MQTRVSQFFVDNRNEISFVAGSGVSFFGVKSALGDVALTLSAPNAANFAPSGIQFTTMPRQLPCADNNGLLSSGRLQMQSIMFPKGAILSNIGFVSGTTAANGPTHQLFGIYDSALNLLATTADGTTTAWAANSLQTFPLTAPFTTTYDGFHYVAMMITVSTTLPSLACFAGGGTAVTGPAAILPVTAGVSTTGLTTSLPSTAAAINAQSTIVYAQVG